MRRQVVFSLLISLVAILAAQSPADATINADQVNATVNCIGGNLAQGPINAFVGLFKFSNVIPSAILNLAKYYEILAFSLVITLVVIRMTVTAARDGIDGILTSMFQTGFGPSVLFAAGFFVCTSMAGGVGSFIPNQMIQGAITYGGRVANDVTNQSGDGQAAASASNALQLDQAIGGGNIGGVMNTGICSAQAVMMGAPPVTVPAGSVPGGATGQLVADKIIGYSTMLAGIVTKALFVGATGGLGLILVCAVMAVKVIVAVYVLWIFARIGFECMALFLTKMFILPLGVVFFALGQLEFVSFLKDAFIRAILSTLARVLVFSLLLPLFVGTFVGAVVIATASAIIPVAGDVVGVFIIMIAAALLDFFLKSYKELADMLVSGGSGPSGHQLGSTIASPIQGAIGTAMSIAGPQLAAAVSGGVMAAIGALGKSGGSIAAGAAKAATPSENTVSEGAGSGADSTPQEGAFPAPSSEPIPAEEPIADLTPAKT